MKISSPSFKNEEFIPVIYTCDGDNISPPLEISDVPANAANLVLIVDDPDAPGGTWTHWIVWNISPHTRAIGEDSVPTGASQGVNSSSEIGYSGPCPPSGTHHYNFTLYALDDVLPLNGVLGPLGPKNSNVGKDELLQAMVGHIVDQAELVGLYSRQK